MPPPSGRPQEVTVIEALRPAISTEHFYRMHDKMGHSSSYRHRIDVASDWNSPIDRVGEDQGQNSVVSGRRSVGVARRGVHRGWVEPEPAAKLNQRGRPIGLRHNRTCTGLGLSSDSVRQS
jgi:hypothetical protein